MTTEMKKQFTFRISQANATEMVVILYEMTLQYLEDAGESAQKEDLAGYQAAVRRTRGCIQELLKSLHMEYEPAGNLRQLYLFCMRRLAQAEIRVHPEILEEITTIIMPLRDAYNRIAAQNTSGPVMQNTQTVYAGLTYGRNNLTENMTDQGMNRGMLV